MENENYVWDFSPLLAGGTEADLLKTRDFVKEKSAAFVAKWKNTDAYLKDPAALAQALEEFEWWMGNCGASGVEDYYWFLRFEKDQNDPAVKAQMAKAEDFANEIKNEMDFFEIRLSKIPENTRAEFLAHPSLSRHRHYLERVFAHGKHILSEPEEKILTLKYQTANDAWKKMVSGFLAREERDVVIDNKAQRKNMSEIQSLLSDTRKSVRDSAAGAFNGILAAHASVAEAEMNALLADKKTDDELRGFQRPDASRHLSDDIESETVDALIEAVSSRFDIPSRYYALKARLMGVEKLAYHERSVPYGAAEKDYPFDEAASLVKKVFEGLDPEFAAIFSRLLEGKNVDVFPAKGKASGAFCAHGLASLPTYVLLNHTDKLRDVLTLAHEMGHAVNNELTRAAQPPLYFGTSTATAEVASTFMEDFVLQEILRDADEELRLSLMMAKLDDDVATIFRQAACYIFEKRTHEEFREKGYLSKERIGDIFSQCMSSYMGPAVEQSEGSANWWVYWSHIRNYFYVYSYASGLLISKALQAKVKSEPAAIASVKEFLSAGVSDSAKGIFAKTGIDISRSDFWKEGLKEVEDLLAQTEDLARKLGKI